MQIALIKTEVQDRRGSSLAREREREREREMHERRYWMASFVDRPSSVQQTLFSGVERRIQGYPFFSFVYLIIQKSFGRELWKSPFSNSFGKRLPPEEKPARL